MVGNIGYCVYYQFYLIVSIYKLSEPFPPLSFLSTPPPSSYPRAQVHSFPLAPALHLSSPHYSSPANQPTMRSAIHGAAAAVLRRADGDEELNCGSGGGADTYFGLRIASIFIILIGSTFGATFPVIARRSRLKNVIPGSVFE